MEVKEYMMGWSCCMHRGDEKSERNIGRKTWKKVTTWKN